MPEYRYSDVEKAYVLAADGELTAAEVAEKIGRPESSVYQMGRRMGVTFAAKPMGSLELKPRGAFVIPEDKMDHYQDIVNRIGKRFGLTAKTKVFLKALDLAMMWLEDGEEFNDLASTDQQAD